MLKLTLQFSILTVLFLILYYYLKSIYALKTLVYKNIPFAYFSASIKPILQLGIVLDISTWNLHLDKTHKMASLVP